MGSSGSRLRPQYVALVLVLVLSSGLFGCNEPKSGSVGGDYASMSSKGESSVSYDSFEGSESGDAGSNDAVALPDETKVVRDVRAFVSSRDFDSADEAFGALVDKYAVLVTSDSYMGYGESDSDSLTHTVSMRVKSEDVDALSDELRASDAWSVESLDVSANDFGASYEDNKSRIESLRVRYDFYKEQAEKATDEQSVMDYTERMLDTLSEIENLERENRQTDVDVAYSTVYLTLSKDVSAASLDTSEGVWQTLVDTLTFLPRNIASALGYFLIFVLWLLPFALIVAIVVLVIRFASKRWRKSHPKPEAASARPAPRGAVRPGEVRRKGAPGIQVFAPRSRPSAEESTSSDVGSSPEPSPEVSDAAGPAEGEDGGVS